MHGPCRPRPESRRMTIQHAQSLGAWLDTNGRELGLVRVSDLVQPREYEATAILAQLETADGGPPVMFDNVGDLDGFPSAPRLLFNAYSRRLSVQRALGLHGDSLREVLDQLPARSADLHPPRLIEDAPVQSVRSREGELDLRRLPWTRHVEFEGGDYFTPIIVARAPGSKRYNLSWNRVMFLDSRHAGVHISPRQLWAFHREAEEAGDDLPAALVLGHHPAFNLAAAALTALTTDEYHVAGALLGGPLEVAPSVSFGDDLLIPAQAELIIEGRLLAGRRVVEGPFGEYMRYLGPQKLSHVFEVDALTSRPRPIILEIFAGHQDHLNAHISIHASLLAAARAAVPQVVDLGWFQGGGPTTAVVALRKSSDGQPMRAAMAVLSAGNLIKQVIMVDHDINVFDAQEVMWAISTRVRAGDDVTILKGLQGSLLDPSHPGFGTTTGFLIDATWPLGQPRPPIARVPEEAVARFPLARYTIEEG
jgi:2,5-furandicarboxylate decarboxylase 1